MNIKGTLPQKVEVYQDKKGTAPFVDWLRSLKDIQARAIIRSRINRIRTGNFDNHRSIGQGIWELKLNYGPGYRVYYGNENQNIVFLLIGGDKGSQDRDIKKAQKYWRDYKAFKVSSEQAL